MQKTHTPTNTEICVFEIDFYSISYMHILRYLVIRGCFHVLELSDLFIKKCYFPVLLLHHLQKSEIIM